MTRVVAALLAAGTLLLQRKRIVHSCTRRGRLPTDLQVGESQFVSYQDLLRLPQVKFTTSDDSNFPAPAHVSGVPLDELKRALGSDADMVVAIAADGYRSNYPAAYLSAHHPVLVLTVNGEAQQGWPKTHEGSWRWDLT